MDYLHGYDASEQERLIEQAKAYAPLIYEKIEWGAQEELKILEIGSGVGAQSLELLKRFPKIKLTCIEISEQQIKKAQKILKDKNLLNRVELIQANAEKLPLAEESFDGVFLCFVLEHLQNPKKVLDEAFRVMKPRAPIYCTEVFNSNFFMNPYSPATLQYCYHFNDHQWNLGGNPFSGAFLRTQLKDSGFSNIQVDFKNFLFDKVNPKSRNVFMKEFLALLLSAQDELLKKKIVSSELVEEMKKEWNKALIDDEAILFFNLVQSHAIAL